MDQHTIITSDHVDSIINWWSMAGLDYYADENPVDWLNPQTAAAKPEITKFPNNSDLVTHVSNAVQTLNMTKVDDWPKSIDEMIKQISSGAALPGNNYGGKSAVAFGSHTPKLMIISDLPDRDEIDAGKLAAGKSRHLLTNMMRAIGQELSDCFVTALATTRPTIGELPEGDAAKLVPFMQHQMNLVCPKEILILGSTACKALFNADLMSVRGSLGNINHNDQIVAAIATYHPRTLLAQPKMKAQAWKDLQMLIKKGNL